MNDCPNIDVLKRYVRRSMHQHEWDRVHQHVNQCDPCTTTISDIEKGLEVTQTLPPTPLIKPRTSDLPTHDHNVGSRESDDQYAIKSLDIPDYKLIKRIGKGAFGEVWIAQPLAGPHCAVKVFSKSTLKATEFEGLKTYRNLVSGHPNLVQVLHVGETQSHYYYVMELADGYNTTPIFSVENYEPRSLNKDLHRNGPCGFDKAIEYTRQILAGLKRLHQEELLHRDIKPANIIVVGGVLKLADIGLITKEDRRGFNAMTRAYAPPEGIQDRSGDLYCLGKTLFEMITGVQPHTYPDWPVAKNPQQEATFKKLRPIVDIACSEKPEDRYPTADDFSADLEKLIALTKPCWLKSNKRGLLMLSALIVIVSGYFLVNSIFTRFEVNRLDVDASVHYSEKNWEPAIELYNQILELEPGNFKAMANSANCKIEQYNSQLPYRDQKLLDDAGDLCKKIPRDNPQEYVSAMITLGVSYRKIEHYELARVVYLYGIDAIATAPSLEGSLLHSMILENLGIAMVFDEQLKDAEKNIRKSAKISGVKGDQCEYPWRNLAAINIYNHKFECKRNLEKAAQCKPDDPLRWLLEARMYLEIEKYYDIQKARNKIVAVLEISDSDYVKSKANRLLAMIELKNEEYQLAYDHALESKTLGDNEVINSFILAIAQFHMGSKEAITSYNHAINKLSESELASRDYIVELQKGLLWIDSAKQVSQLRLQAEKLIFSPNTDQ